MKIIWEYTAKLQLKKVANYVKKGFGIKRVRLFYKEVQHTTQLLISNPYIGALDPLLSGRSKSYRSILVNKLNKSFILLTRMLFILLHFGTADKNR